MAIREQEVTWDQSVTLDWTVQKEAKVITAWSGGKEEQAGLDSKDCLVTMDFLDCQECLDSRV